MKKNMALPIMAFVFLVLSIAIIFYSIVALYNKTRLSTELTFEVAIVAKETVPAPAPASELPTATLIPAKSTATPRATATQIPTLMPTPTAVKALPEPTEGATNASDPPQATAKLSYESLIKEYRVNESAGFRQIVYHLPQAILADQSFLLAIGQQMPTRFKEKLPKGVLAVASQFPKDVTGSLGPFVWTQADGVARGLYNQNMKSVYAAMDYPGLLYGEIYIQAPFGYPGQVFRMPFQPTDRIRGIAGREYSAGAIRRGAVYLFADEKGNWGLREYPDIPENGDAAYMIWEFNPVSRATGKREFVIPANLRQSQLREQAIAMRDPKSLRDNVGPSIFFRTDLRSGQSDIVITAPYIYLDNPEILKNILFSTPLPSGVMPDQDSLLVAAGDLHYSCNGKLGLLLGIDKDPLFISERKSEEALNLSSVINHTGFYLGKNLPEKKND